MPSAIAGCANVSSASCGSSASTPPAGRAACAISQLIHGLQLANIGLNRKTLADLAIADPKMFDQIAEMAKKSIG